MLITATTATPLAVRTGFCRRNGTSLGLYSTGMDERMSVMRGTPGSLNLRAAFALRAVKLRDSFAS